MTLGLALIIYKSLLFMTLGLALMTIVIGTCVVRNRETSTGNGRIFP
jgi:hypothetical protein